MDLQQIKQRFGIIGGSPKLNHAIGIATQVAPTDISVLINGESGTGKEVFPQIIHHLSARKHGPYIAVNCGAIPDGTIDSELFGHEKGAFTGAHESRKGYFEVADGGTLFLDEVAELPLQTQVRLLRVLETGEFIKVGSSKVIKSNIRVVAATNINVNEAISKGRFREDLYYRLNTVPIQIPPLRDRREDINLLFRKFSADFAEKYRMPAVRLNENAQKSLASFPWPGNVRQLKNVTEQISVVEEERDITLEILAKYLPSHQNSKLPMVIGDSKAGSDFSEREILYKVLFDMKKDMTKLKKIVLDLVEKGVDPMVHEDNATIIKKLYQQVDIPNEPLEPVVMQSSNLDNLDNLDHSEQYHEPEEIIEESLSLEEREKELIIKALTKHKGKRKYASEELGISERTLYRKIKEYDLN
ncbi:MAG: sigma-54-dependent Fis family transcriptional regulator [Flavobacteriales bacterium]|nr:sigma-54-dependent Fis family transcriptional regulator [Flavobacteriales bacterium]